MKIIIDISDYLFEVIKKSGSGAPKVIDDAIVNGIPLPKNHGRLIDADELLKKSEWFGEKLTYDNPYPFGADAVRTLDIEKSPTIIPADKEIQYRCGHCGVDVEAWYKDCPHCGYKFVEPRIMHILTQHGKMKSEEE